LGIGEDHHIVPAEVESEGVLIKIYSPTDCVKDRLASYLYFNDSESLDQTLLVAKSKPVDLKEIKKWCKNEKHPEVYTDFKNKFDNLK